MPIEYRDTLTGILILGGKNDKGAFLQADVDLLVTVASEAGIALANARLLEELRQAVRARDDFLSVAGHELRTPLTALQLNVHGALSGKAPPESLRARLEATDRQVARLARLTNDLLDVSRITATRRLPLERKPVDLAEVARDVAARFAGELQRAGSALELAAAGPVIGSWDRGRVEQVVSNLLANAVKYGRGRPIALSVEGLHSSARLTVRDQGIGIAEADQVRIFDRFERAVSREHQGGFGLGLWITRQVVEAHRGTIRVTSKVGEGSEFVVDLPLAEGVPREE